MTGDEIHLYTDASYEPANISIFSKAKRSYEIYNDAIQYRPNIIPASWSISRVNRIVIRNQMKSHTTGSRYEYTSQSLIHSEEYLRRITSIKNPRCNDYILLHVNLEAHVAVTDLLFTHTTKQQRYAHDLVPKLHQQTIYTPDYISPRHISMRVIYSRHTPTESYHHRRNFSLPRNYQAFPAPAPTKTH